MRLHPAFWVGQAKRRERAPMTPLASGPTSATTSSVEGLRLSPSIRVTPPMNQSVIPSTCSPARCAATAWATSWTSTPASNATAVRTPANQ